MPRLMWPQIVAWKAMTNYSWSITFKCENTPNYILFHCGINIINVLTRMTVCSHLVKYLITDMQSLDQCTITLGQLHALGIAVWSLINNTARLALNSFMIYLIYHDLLHLTSKLCLLDRQEDLYTNNVYYVVVRECLRRLPWSHQNWHAGCYEYSLA